MHSSSTREVKVEEDYGSCNSRSSHSGDGEGVRVVEGRQVCEEEEELQGDIRAHEGMVELVMPMTTAARDDFEVVR